MSVVRWSVSVTPEVTEPVEAGGHQAFTTLHEDIGRTLGGSGSITWSETIQDSNWAGGVHTEELAQATSGNGIATAACDMLFVKHSGFQDVAHTTASSDRLDIRDNSNPASGNTIISIGPGEAICLPKPEIAMYLLAEANTVSVEWAELT
jgi:hypothetical protein|tara:strand:+ start:2261 stop:2710 length:450 start_codon:yes stop_codon:yes gene_type:complete